jgi:hypothetical protein
MSERGDGFEIERHLSRTKASRRDVLLSIGRLSAAVSIAVVLLGGNKVDARGRRRSNDQGENEDDQGENEDDQGENEQ